MSLNRRLQFSLRSLLAVVALCAVYCGIRYGARAREEAAIVRLVNAGANVSYLTHDESGVLKVWAERPRARGYLRRFLDFVWPVSYTVAVWVTADDMNDALWSQMPQIRRLTDLEVQGAEVTNAGKRAISTLTALKSLKLDMDFTSKEECQILSHLRGLRTLRLWGSVKFDCCSRNIVELQELEELSIENAWLTDAHLAQLGKLKKLRSLRLGRIGGGATLAGVDDLRRTLPNCAVVIQAADP